MAATTDVGIGRLCAIGQRWSGARNGAKTRAQLELERRSLSKIGDGYATRHARPRGVAVFDF